MKELSFNEIQQVSAGNLPTLISKVIVMGFCSYGVPLLTTITLGAGMEALGADSETHSHMLPFYLGIGAVTGLTFGIYLTNSF